MWLARQTCTRRCRSGTVQHAPWQLELPSPTAFVRDRRHKAAQRFETVVSLRHWWEWNYFHFYMDVLGKLAALDSAGISFDTPIAIGRYYNQLSWVRELLSCGSLADRRWIVHDEGLIEARSVVYCQARMTYRERADYVVRALGAPAAPSSGNRRIFLKRMVSRMLIAPRCRSRRRWSFSRARGISWPSTGQVSSTSSTVKVSR